MTVIEYGILLMVWARREWFAPANAAILLTLADGTSKTKKEISDSISVRATPIIERELRDMREHDLIAACGSKGDKYAITPEGKKAINRLNKLLRG